MGERIKQIHSKLVPTLQDNKDNYDQAINHIININASANIVN